MPPVLDRALLWLNHVLAAEPAATARLAVHAGRKVTVHWQGPAGPWPVPPDLVLRITPAGLCETVEAEPDASSPPSAGLRVTVALPAPHELLSLWFAGKRPAVSVEGDARFAADVAWLVENLRWDVEHDLARFVGDAAAHEFVRFGTALRDALRSATGGINDLWSRRPGAGAATSQ